MLSGLRIYICLFWTVGHSFVYLLGCDRTRGSILETVPNLCAGVFNKWHVASIGQSCLATWDKVIGN